MKDKHWNWDHIRFFLALAEHGTLSAAGRELAVSHSTVLRRVRAFEASLQTSLFETTSAGYQLNNSGQELHAQAIQMKFALEAVARDIAGSDGVLAGEIVIATTDSLSYFLLPKILRELSELHKDLTFKIVMGSQLSKIEDREVDIAVRTCKTPPDNLIGRKIGNLRFTACASPDYIQQHELTSFPATTDGHRYILLDDSFRGVPFHDWMTNIIGLHANVLEVNNFLLASAMCQAGLGITVLPSYMVDAEPLLQSLPTKEPIDNNTLWILCHSNLRDTERIRRVRRFIFEALSEQFSV